MDIINKLVKDKTGDILEETLYPEDNDTVPGRAGDEFILAGSPGPAGASYRLIIFFFFEVSDSDLRLSRFIAKLGNEIMYTIK